MNVYDRLIAEFGNDIRDHSAICRFEAMTALIEKGFRGGNIVEIGTYRGAGAVLLAEYADHVYTFDPNPQADVRQVWDRMGVADKITLLDPDGTADVSGLDFSFAFIDGDHSFDQAARDFLAVKQCGSVLFHDYLYPKFPDVTVLVDSLDGHRTEVDVRHKPLQEYAETWAKQNGVYRCGTVERRVMVALWEN